MPNMTVEQARENLFNKASRLTVDQMPAIFAALKKVLDEMSGEFLWPAVRTAHQAKGIKAETFARDLFVSDGLKKPIHKKTEKWDALADPYSQLDIKVWCEYLMFGKDRVLDNRVTPARKAKDQDAFFDFIHVPVYFPLRTPNGINKEVEHKEFTAFAECLKKVHTTRNWIEHENCIDATLEELAAAVFCLSEILSKMNYTSWNEDRDLWKRRLMRVFFDTIGVIDYPVDAVMDYINAVGCSVSAQQQSALEQLMKDADMDISDGKISFSGNITDFIARELAEAWNLSQTNRVAGVKKLKQALQRPLPPYALLSEEQKLRAVEILEEYSPKLKEPLVEIVRAAHASEGIAVKTFEDNLYIIDGTGGKPLLDPQYRWKADADPYKRLDLHGWLKYLRFGGCRRDANGDSVVDQDAVFTFLNIPYSYTSDAVRKLDCDFANHLTHLNDARNNITSHWAPATVEKTTTAEIMQWYESLLAVLEPMSRKDWQKKDACQKLMDDITGDFKAALGGLTYSIADILEYLKPSKYTQPEVEARLVELGYPVSNGGVTIDEDIESFLKTLPVALDLMEDMRRLPEDYNVAQKLTRQIKDRARVYEERAVRWFEKRAYGPNPVPAALYYLGCCGLFHRATRLDRHESVTMIRCAAKKGNTLAQIRMGQYHEGWYRYLWNNQNDWKVQQDNSSLRSDGPEIGKDWQDNATEQNRKTVNPAEAFAWYQKAADKEYPDSLYHLGRCYRDAIGTQYDAEQAYQCFWEAAQLAHLPAQYALALCYDGETPGIDVNRKKAWEFYEALIEKNYTPAMRTLGQRYATLRNNQRDLVKAVTLMSQAGSQGDAAAYMELAHWFLDGKLVAPNDKEGFRWLKRAAKAGDAEGLRVLGECCLFGIGVEKDAQQAYALLSEAAVAGDELAQWALGNCLADGIGRPEDMFGAVQYRFEKAKELDPIVKGICESYTHTWGYQFLALSDTPQPYQSAIDLLLPVVRNEPDSDGDVTVSNGQDQQLFGNITEDPAFLLYTMDCHFDKKTEVAAERLASCRNNLFNRLEAARMRITRAIACYELAECYKRGKDTAAETIVWYTEAAEQGLRKAMRALGHCYTEGIGVAADVRQAVQWYQKAVDAGDAKSMSILADCYLQNWDCLPEVPDAQAARDIAVDLYLRAYRLGNLDAYDKLNAMHVEIDNTTRGSFTMDCWLGYKLPILEDL